tara:strand:- start:219 stop:1007 length:789 start_codon:yes stop_codon:yes gene_type:complete
MTIKQQGGVFGRNPKFNNVDVNGNLTVDTNVLYVDAASNKVGINTSSPTQALELSGSSGARAAFLDSGSRRWSIGNITGGGTSFSITDESGSTDALVFASSTGNASFSGNLIVSSGNGIDFSATAGTGTSELFDDYEEGTFGPSFEPLSGSFTSIAYTHQAGNYTKVGNIVTIDLRIRTSSVDTTGGTGLKIGGLPYSEGGSGGGFAIGFIGDWATDPYILKPVNDTIYMYSSTGTAITHTALNTGSNDNELHIGGSYVASS